MTNREFYNSNGFDFNEIINSWKLDGSPDFGEWLDREVTVLNEFNVNDVIKSRRNIDERIHIITDMIKYSNGSGFYVIDGLHEGKDSFIPITKSFLYAKIGTMTRTDDNQK